MEREDVIVLDLRPESEYRQSHIKGAVSIPFSELEERLSELPQDREVVAYCRGTFCVWSVESIQMLRKQGIEAHRLEDGLPEWRLAGLPTEQGDKA